MERSIKYIFIYLHKTVKYLSCQEIYYVVWREREKKKNAHGPLIALSFPGITLLTIAAQPQQNLEHSQE